jgi:purine nucleosidase
VQVVVGENKPLKRDFGGHSAKMVHGDNGIGEVQLQANTNYTTKPTAAEYLIETCKAAPGEITILALAPLTNIAKAIELDPTFPLSVEHLILMGGSFEHCGNIRPLAEANIYNDPEAAQMVFSSRWNRITIIPLNLTHNLRYSNPLIDEVEAIGNKAGKLFGSTQRFYLGFHHSIGASSSPLHDPTVVLYCLCPELFEVSKEVKVHVECEGKLTRGVTIADFSDKFREDLDTSQYPLSRIALHCHDPAKCFDILKIAISSLP